MATVESSEMKLYKDGALEGTKSDGGEPTEHTRSNHYIGKGFLDRYFPGTIAYVRFWHGKALDASQVAELYASSI